MSQENQYSIIDLTESGDEMEELSVVSQEMKNSPDFPPQKPATKKKESSVKPVKKLSTKMKGLSVIPPKKLKPNRKWPSLNLKKGKEVENKISFMKENVLVVVKWLRKASGMMETLNSAMPMLAELVEYTSKKIKTDVENKTHQLERERDSFRIVSAMQELSNVSKQEGFMEAMNDWPCEIIERVFNIWQMLEAMCQTDILPKTSCGPNKENVKVCACGAQPPDGNYIQCQFCGWSFHTSCFGNGAIKLGPFVCRNCHMTVNNMRIITSGK